MRRSEQVDISELVAHIEGYYVAYIVRYLILYLARAEAARGNNKEYTERRAVAGELPDYALVFVIRLFPERRVVVYNRDYRRHDIAVGADILTEASASDSLFSVFENVGDHIEKLLRFLGVVFIHYSADMLVLFKGLEHMIAVVYGINIQLRRRIHIYKRPDERLKEGALSAGCVSAYRKMSVLCKIDIERNLRLIHRVVAQTDGRGQRP